MFKRFTLILFFAVALGFTSGSFAQGRPCPNPGGGGPCNPPPVPINGAIGILFALGAGYAIKKIKEQNNS